MFEIFGFIMVVAGMAMALLFLTFFWLIWGLDAFIMILCGYGIVGLIALRKSISNTWLGILGFSFVVVLIISVYRFIF